MEDTVKVYTFNLPLGTISIQSKIDLSPFNMFCIEEWRHTLEHPEGAMSHELFLRINDYVLFKITEDGTSKYTDNDPLVPVGDWSRSTIYKCTLEEQKLINDVFKKCAFTKPYIVQYNKLISQLKNSGCKVDNLYAHYEEELDYGEQI